MFQTTNQRHFAPAELRSLEKLLSIDISSLTGLKLKKNVAERWS
jgi:hypothetical protein